MEEKETNQNEEHEHLQARVLYASEHPCEHQQLIQGNKEGTSNQDPEIKEATVLVANEKDFELVLFESYRIGGKAPNEVEESVALKLQHEREHRAAAEAIYQDSAEYHFGVAFYQKQNGKKGFATFFECLPDDGVESLKGTEHDQRIRKAPSTLSKYDNE